LNLSKTISKDQCYHCGTDCASKEVHIEEKIFCCDGCKMVYQVLDANGMDSYYRLASNPGTNMAGAFEVKNEADATRFSYLDDPNTVTRLIDFTNGEVSSITLDIPAIHCASCIWLLENLRKLQRGILGAKVNFMKRKLAITWQNSETTLKDVVALLASIGYEPELNLDTIQNKQSFFSGSQKEWLKLGYAGFAFGNIMLFSFPEYLATAPLGQGFNWVFGGLNLILAIPILLFSGVDYLKSGWAAIRQGKVNLDVPISIGMLALFFRSAVEILFQLGPGYMDSFAGLIFLLLIGRWVQRKTTDHLAFDRDYRSYFPISTTRISQDGKEEHINIDHLKQGDMIYVRNKELIPADALLLDNEALIDYSFVSGEADALTIKKGSMVFAGGRVVGKSTQFVVEKTADAGYLTQLWNDAAFDKKDKEQRVQNFADRISAPFTLVVMGIALVAGGYWTAAADWGKGLEVVTAVLIIACPCALALSAPFTFGSAINVLARNGFYIKNARIFENLSRINTAVFDKTGTLTSMRDSIIKQDLRVELSQKEWSMVYQLAMQSTHPLSAKLGSWLNEQHQKLLLIELTEIEEQTGKGLCAKLGESSVKLGSLSYLREELVANVPAKESKHTAVHLAINGRYAGCFKFSSKVREGMRNLLNELKKDIRLFVLSGDSNRDAAIFSDHFGKDDMHFGKSPQQKLAFIKELQSDGSKVLMVGDGLNDAGALVQSDFGLALTEKVTAFSPASDGIIDAKRLLDLGTFIRFSQKALIVVYLSFGISLTYNIIGISFAVQGLLSPLVSAILMPVSSLTIIAFTTTVVSQLAKRMKI
jgi:Cu+-exporting ATPase